MHERILVVDDSRSIRTLVSRKLERELGMEVDTAEDLQSTIQILENRESDYLMAVVDLNLPDAPDGEVVDYVSSKGISSVVLTGNFDEQIRKKLYSKNIIDYLIKEGGHDLDIIVQTVVRLKANSSCKILVVDDSKFTLDLIKRLLNRQHFQVLTAENGREALNVLESDSEIKMVITDYNMPEMDGFELTVKLRQKFGKDRLSIIGISGAEDDYFTAKFIKLGANDFLKKPFGTEEFYCRVTQNLELLGMIQHIKEASNTDYLTKLFNRRYFFDSGTRAFLRAIQDGVPMALAMLDIDFFKRINDTFGHEGGDEALKTVAQLLKDQSRPSDFVARFGGEEFCMLLVGIEPTDAFAKMEHLRKSIGAIRIPFEEKVIQFTVSMGLVTDKGMSLPKMINLADRRLYLAKSEGRNRLIAEGE